MPTLTEVFQQWVNNAKNIIQLGTVTNIDKTQYYVPVQRNGEQVKRVQASELGVEGGATNLSYTPSPTGGTLSSSTGTGATLPLTDATNAGLFSPEEKVNLANLALRYIDESNGIGVVLAGRNAANYGNVGLGALDASYSFAASTVNGATAQYSAAFGANIIGGGQYGLSGGFSVTNLALMGMAWGSSLSNNIARSIAVGDNLTNSGFGTGQPGAVFGKFNDNTSFSGRNVLLQLGIGASSAARANILTVTDKGMVLHPVALTSVTPFEGMIISDSEDSNRLKRYRNGAWAYLGDVTTDTEQTITGVKTIDADIALTQGNRLLINNTFFQSSISGRLELLHSDIFRITGANAYAEFDNFGRLNIVNNASAKIYFTDGTYGTYTIGRDRYEIGNLAQDFRAANVDFFQIDPINNSFTLGKGDRNLATKAKVILAPQLAAPTSATDTGVAGEIRFDSNYMYRCVATNTWKRTALSTW